MRSISQLEGDRPLLQLENIGVDYGMIHALDSVNLSLKPSEIHAIVGEHGAGKSSIAKVVAGYLKPSGGEVWIDGVRLNRISIKECRRRGIELVQQNINLFEDLSVAYNLFINSGRQSRGPFYYHKNVVRAAQAFLDSFGIDIDAKNRIRNLHFSERVLVEILKGIRVEPRLLILDESLEKLTSEMLEKVILAFKSLRERGSTILFITHRIDDLYDLADRVTILREGKILLTDSVSNIDKINLIRLAYTQFLRADPIKSRDSHFYRLMKYNEAILRKLPVNLLVADSEGFICMSNEAATACFHIPEPINSPRPLRDLIPVGNETALDRILEILSSRQEAVLDLQLKIDGHARIYNCICYPIQDGPSFIGSIIILNDISEQENLKTQLNLSERLASVGLLAAGVAHEINNPLEIIFNYLDLLKFSVKEEEASAFLMQIEDEIVNIESIVSNLGSFSDGRQARGEVFDINDVVDNLLRLLNFTFIKRRVVIEHQPLKQDLPVYASKAEIRQVFLNIIKNGFEAMPMGGILKITERVEDTDGRLLVYVVLSDNGPGIPEENLKDVFLPFYSTKKDANQNRGLGLYLSYQILKKYDGSISIENDHDRGCRVTIALPVYITGTM
jgi:ABC-type branched-subunit amino acid transport system ATPase component/nitrogen-specific signal transduction histidine kinase